VNGPIRRHLVEDHGRLEAHLARAASDPARIDLDEFRRFRAGLLRHIGIEEKILLPAARRLCGGDPLPVARRLRLDHSALATLLVPTPTHALVAEIRRVLASHNPLEEDEGGMYDQVDGLLTPAEAEALLGRIRAVPEPPCAPYRDDPRIHARIARLLRDARGGA
jgi:hypothetical protein